MTNKKLENLVIGALNKLALNDRDLRTIVIWCNPHIARNFPSDHQIKPKVLEILKELEKKGLVARQKKKLGTAVTGTGLIEYELWSVIENLGHNSLKLI